MVSTMIPFWFGAGFRHPPLTCSYIPSIPVAAGLGRAEWTPGTRIRTRCADLMAADMANLDMASEPRSAF